MDLSLWIHYKELGYASLQWIILGAEGMGIKMIIAAVIFCRAFYLQSRSVHICFHKLDIAISTQEGEQFRFQVSATQGENIETSKGIQRVVDLKCGIISIQMHCDILDIDALPFGTATDGHSRNGQEGQSRGDVSHHSPIHLKN